MDKSSRLYLLDAYALIFRAYYALIRMPRITSSGFNTSAIFGFVNTLEELLRKENPEFLAVCFDPPGPTFRHEAYDAYKGEREATPEDIRLSVPVIKEILEAYNIPVLEVPGFEADDVIGTMATRAAAEGITAVMMTPDKDFAQLVSDRILQYKPSYRGQDFELRGVKEVCERYGIETPSQVKDLLALMGDKADNIPGCPGVGEKTASRLIREYGSVEALIAGSQSLKGALRKKVEDNSEQIVFSKYLATIRTDVPVDADISSLSRREPDIPRLMEIFSRLEFRTLIGRLRKRGDSSAATAKREAVQGSLFDEEESEDAAAGSCGSTAEAYAVPEHIDVTCVSEASHIEEFESMVRRAGCVALMTLADGEADMTATPLGWIAAIKGEDAKAWYLPASVPDVPCCVSRLYASDKVTCLSADVKRDCVCLHNCGARDGITHYFDVTVAHYLLHPDMRHSLEIIASSLIGVELVPYEGIAGKKGVRQLRPSQVPSETLMSWGAARVHALLLLHEPLLRELERQEMLPLLREIELPLIPVLADMEITGVRVDVQALNEAARSLTLRIDGIEKEIHTLAGEEFNVGSPAKVGEILFDKLGLSAKPRKTKTGQYSTSEEELEKISHLSPIVGKILEYRQLRKLLNTYLTALPATINPSTGRIHTTYNQTVTATGRISSSDPNLQNIPVREAVGREIRRAFIPSEGNVFLSADYSQIELRLVADFASDPDMLAAFASGSDIHAMTAAKMYHESPEHVSAEQRRKAKTANFGILYGISAFGLSQRLNISRAEAKELIDNYFAKFPTIHGYITTAIEQAREKGYVSTIMGRRRPLPDITSRNATVRGYAERNAVNAPIQGSAADIIKIAMVSIHREMKARGMASRMIMQVHDELNFDVVPAELPALRALVVREMEAAYVGKVRLTASVGTGPDWLSAH